MGSWTWRFSSSPGSTGHISGEHGTHLRGARDTLQESSNQIEQGYEMNQRLK
jgi:hypothetical protein